MLVPGVIAKYPWMGVGSDSTARCMRLIPARCGLLGLLVASLAVATAEGAEPVSVYSSMAGDPTSTATVRGIRLALKESGSASGPFTIRYVPLGKKDLPAGRRDAARNARTAAADPATIAYIGELDSAHTAVSMPILNRSGIAQISPSSTAIGLTRGDPGAARGEPGRYYPTSRRHFFRLMSNDRVHGAALATLMGRRRCRRVAVISDRAVFGVGLGYWVRGFARANRLRVVFRGTIRPRRRSYRGLAERARRRRAQCVVYTGVTQSGAVRLYRDLARVLPKARLFGSHWVFNPDFLARLTRGVARRLLITSAWRDPFALPPAGQQFLRRYRREYQEEDPHPYAAYGYEAMRLILDAVATAGPDRRAVIDRLSHVHRRRSVLGTYSFDRYGDTTRTEYSVYSFDRKNAYFEGTVRPKVAPRD